MKAPPQYSKRQRLSVGYLASLVLLPWALTGCPTTVSGQTPAGADAAAPEQAPEPEPDDSCGDMVYKVVETEEGLTVPDDVQYMHLKIWGAGGNGQGECGLPDEEGGLGGFTEAVFAVQPGEVYTVLVGQRGRKGLTGETMDRFGFGAWGGGGLSGVFRDGGAVSATDQERALAIAGGGGSAGTGECRPGGTGNHPDSGGETTMQGTLGEDDGFNGGGGGYRGGTGGKRGMPGRGGEGYVDPSAIDEGRHFEQPGAKRPPRSDDPDYDGTAGATEKPGLVVVSFTCSPVDVPDGNVPDDGPGPVD